MGDLSFEVLPRGYAMEDNNKPFVSLCITCFNQAEYIRGAVQSALNQTYSPLEIVICDDASTDGTDKIIQQMVKSYTGPHRVVFKRNGKNLNVIKNYEQAFKLAKGELLITGAGDDISMPNRVEVIVGAWVAGGKKAKVIHHAWFNIDEKGRCIGWGGPRESYCPLGACSAYSADVFRFFPSVEVDGAYEDMVFCPRACMLGDDLRLEERLICYRYGGTTASHVNLYEMAVKGSRRELTSQLQMEKDVEFARGKVDSHRLVKVEEANLKRKKEAEDRLDFLTAKSIATRAAIARNRHMPLRGWGFWCRTIFVLPRIIATPLSNMYMRWQRFKAVYVNTYRDPPKDYMAVAELCKRAMA